MNTKRRELRPAPSSLSYKPSKRHWNELEQTPNSLAYSQPGTPEYRKFYRFASQVFDGEAHHMVDLGYIDKMLYKAGFTTGAKGTKDYGEARQRIIEKLRNSGVDVGNVEANISPLSKKQPKYNKTGIAHTFVHDAYNKIPEASDKYLRTLNENEFTNYLVEKGRQRKDYVVQALEHKYNSLMAAHPELKGKSDKAVRDWINNNRQEFGSLGDKTLSVTRRNPVPVPGQQRGRVAIKPEINSLFRYTDNSFLGIADPITPAIAGVPEALRALKNNRAGATIGGISSTLADPEAVADALEGDIGGATKKLASGALGGAALQNLLKITPTGAQKFAGRALPILAGAQIFAEGRDNSATNRIVNKAADFLPGLQADPETDIGKRTGEYLTAKANQLRENLKPRLNGSGNGPGRNGIRNGRVKVGENSGNGGRSGAKRRKELIT